MIGQIISNTSTQEAFKMLEMLNSKPDDAMKNFLALIEIIDKDNMLYKQKEVFKKVVNDPDNNWNKLFLSLWKDIDDNVRNKLLENIVINVLLESPAKQARIRKKHGCNIPVVIQMDPTAECNMECFGCWESITGDKHSMDFSTLDNIISQGKSMGIYLYVYSGGEPLLREEDIIELCEKHQKCIFMALTNGTLINDDFANKMLRVKNFIPVISMEGFEEETDRRKGSGTFRSILKAMRILKDKKLLFGVSTTYTRKNTEIVGSEDFVDTIITVGAKFAWYFTYMPVGVGAPINLITQAEQREFIYEQIRKFRSEKQLLLVDFLNDGEYFGGCIGGGRKYLHINANGDIEPCSRVQYSDSNIHKNTILDACKSPLFMKYYEDQPFNENMLRQCPLLDNQDTLAEIIEETGAAPSNIEEPEDVINLCAKCYGIARKWASVADPIWESMLQHKSTD